MSTSRARWMARLYRIGLAAVIAGAVTAVPLASPANAAAPPVRPVGDNFSIVMQANTNTLWTADSVGNAGGNTGFAIAPGTNPAIAGLATGGTEFAWQTPAGTLNLYGPGGLVATGLPMRPGTSPSITALPSGGYQVAFQGSDGDLWDYGTRGTKDWGLRMNPNSSPSIAVVLGGVYVIAAETILNKLYLEQEGFQFGFNLGMAMMPGTSPAIAGPPTIGSVIAFQNAAGTLSYFSSAVGPGATNTGLPMMAGTSPAISTTGPGNDWQIAYQANNGSVATYGTLGQGVLGLGMLSGTSPSITGFANGGYEIAFQANTTSLWITGSAGTRSLNLGMAPGAAPSITAIL